MLLKINQNLTFAALIILALGVFTSITFSALAHILLLIPGIYFAARHVSGIKWGPFPKSGWALIGVIASIGLSVLFNQDILSTPGKNFFKAKYFVFGILGIFAFREIYYNYLDEKKKKILLHLFIWSTTLATLSGLIGLFSGFNPIKMKEACHHSRACGLFGMYMTYGYGISLFTVLLTGLLLHQKKVKLIGKGPLLVALGVSLLGLFFSYARGGWIAFAFSVPFFFFKKNKALFLKVTLSLVLVGGIFAASVPQVRDMFFNRAASNTIRISMFHASLFAFKERPLFGWGYRNFEPHSAKIKGKYKLEWPEFVGHAHNNLLEHLASTGIVGVIFTLGFFLFWAIEVYQRDDLVGLILFPFVLNFLFSGMFQYTFGDGENLFLILTIYGLSQIPPQKDQTSEKDLELHA